MLFSERDVASQLINFCKGYVRLLHFTGLLELSSGRLQIARTLRQAQFRFTLFQQNKSVLVILCCISVISLHELAARDLHDNTRDFCRLKIVSLKPVLQAQQSFLVKLYGLLNLIMFSEGIGQLTKQESSIFRLQSTEQRVFQLSGQGLCLIGPIQLKQSVDQLK